MTDLSNRDDEARAELLFYLVVEQLIARARTGDWLRTDHVVELQSIWLRGNGAQTNGLDRAHLGAQSENVAPHFAELPWAADSDSDSDSLAHLFTAGWRMDYRSLIVRTIYAACGVTLKPARAVNPRKTARPATLPRAPKNYNAKTSMGRLRLTAATWQKCSSVR